MTTHLPGQRRSRRAAGRCSRRAGAVAVAGGLAAALALPATGTADVLLGSNLSAPADVQINTGVDSAFWHTALASGANPTVPAAGQVILIRLKGFAPRSRTGARPLTQIHFQDLRPRADGNLKIISSSQPFDLPVGRGPNRVSTYRPTNMFVAAGDYLAFNDEGGFDPGRGFVPGVPYQVFARVAGSTTQRFSLDNGTKNGAVISGTAHDDTELLMQVQLSLETAGASASAPSQTAPVSGRGVAQPLIACDGENTCVGHLLLTAHGADAAAVGRARAAKTLILGRGSFQISPHSRKRVRAKLKKKARGLLRRHHGRLKAVLTIATGKGGPAHSANATIRLALKR